MLQAHETLLHVHVGVCLATTCMCWVHAKLAGVSHLKIKDFVEIIYTHTVVLAFFVCLEFQKLPHVGNTSLHVASLHPPSSHYKKPKKSS